LLKRRISREWLVEDIDPPLRAIFSPIFFGYIGLSMSVILHDGDFSLGEVLPLIIVLGVLVLVGKIVGCGLGAKLLRFKNRESLTIGCAMCGRGALELVLLSFGLEIEAISEPQFISLVIVTLITIIFTPILYAIALKFEERAESSEEES
jgi:Kef-type K+ transport system membrane component KefB